MKSFEFEVNNPRNAIREELFILQIVERVLAGFLSSVTSIDQSLYCEILAKRCRNNLPIQPIHLEIMKLIKQSLEKNNIPIKEDKVHYKIKTVATQRIKYITRNQQLTTREQQTTENNTQFSSPKHSTRGKYIIFGKQQKSNKIDNYLYLNKSQQQMTAKKQIMNQFQLVNSNSSQLETNNTKDNNKLILQSQAELKQRYISQGVSKFEHIINENICKSQTSQEQNHQDSEVKQPKKNLPYLETQLQSNKQETQKDQDGAKQQIVTQQQLNPVQVKQNMKMQKNDQNSSNVAPQKQFNQKSDFKEQTIYQIEGQCIINQEQQIQCEKQIDCQDILTTFVEKQKFRQLADKSKQNKNQLASSQKGVEQLDLTNQQINYTSQDENYFSPQNATQQDKYFQRPSIAISQFQKESEEHETINFSEQHNKTSIRQIEKSNIFIFPPKSEEQQEKIEQKENDKIPMTQSLKFQIKIDQIEYPEPNTPKKQQSLFQIPHDDEYIQNRQTSIQQINIQISQCFFDESSEKPIPQEQVLNEENLSQQKSINTHKFDQPKTDETKFRNFEQERLQSQQFSSSHTQIQQQTPSTLQINQFNNDNHSLTKQFKSSTNIVIPGRFESTQHKQNYSNSNKSKNEKSLKSKDPNSYQKSEDSQPGSKKTIDISQGEKYIKPKNVKKQKQLQLPTNNLPNSVRRKSSNIILPFDAKKHEQQEKERKRQSEYLKLLDQIKAEREFMEQFTMPENMSLNQKKAIIEHLINQLENNSDQDLKYQIMLYKQRQEQISSLAKQELIFTSGQNTCYNEIEQLTEQKIKSLNKDEFQKTILMKFGNQVQTNFTTGQKQQNQEADSPLKRDYKVLSKLHPVEIERQINRINEFKQEGELLKLFRSFNSLYNKEVNQCDLDYPIEQESLGSAKPGTGLLSTATTRRKFNLGKTAKLGIKMRRIKENIQKRFKTQESNQQ